MEEEKCTDCSHCKNINGNLYCAPTGKIVNKSKPCALWGQFWSNNCLLSTVQSGVESTETSNH